MAELGSTTDPRALVPGNPAVARGLAASFTDRSARAEDAARRLSLVRVPSWTGEAADSFEEVMAAQPRSWRITADGLTTAARLLSDYAEALGAAQADAALAIETWARGESATADSARSHQDSVRRFHQAVSDGRSAIAPDPYVDAGAPLRREAQDLLEGARSAVKQAGDVAAAAFGRIEVTDLWLFDGATSSDWLTASGSTSGSLFRWDPVKGEGSWGLASAQGEANLWEGRAWGEARRGGTTLSGEIEARVGIDGEAKAGLDDGNLKLGASGRAGVIVEGEGRFANEGGETALSLKGFGGASAGLGTSIGKDGVSSEADLFVGGKYGTDLSGKIGPIDVTGTVEGWNGYGLKADYDIGRNEDGDWVFGGSAGAARQHGLGYKVHFTVDPDDLWASIQQALPFLDETRG